jgi:hypothetical protein
VGLVCLGFSIIYLFGLRDQLPELNDGMFAASLGAGIYLCLVASVLVLIGAVATLQRKRERILLTCAGALLIVGLVVALGFAPSQTPANTEPTAMSVAGGGIVTPHNATTLGEFYKKYTGTESKIITLGSVPNDDWYIIQMTADGDDNTEAVRCEGRADLQLRRRLLPGRGEVLRWPDLGHTRCRQNAAEHHRCLDG